MRLPHIDQDNRDCFAPLRECLPPPRSIALSPQLTSRTTFTARDGLVHNTALEGLSGGQAGHAYNSPLSIGVRPLGQHATALMLCLMGVPNDVGKLVMKLSGTHPQPVIIAIPLARGLFLGNQWGEIREAIRPGMRVALAISSLTYGVAASVREHHISAAVAQALTAEFDRQSANGEVASVEATVKGYQSELQALNGTHPAQGAMVWEDNVPVTFHRPRNRTGR